MKEETPLPTRNPLTHRRHRREVFWQITFPLVLGSILTLGVCVLTAFAGFNAGVSMWRDISLIWLIAPAMVLLLLFLALTGAAAYGIIRLIQVLPVYFLRLQVVLERIAARSYQISDKILQPLVRLRSGMAGLQAALRKREQGL